MIEITNAFLALVPVIIGVVEVIKRVGLPSKWAPLLALLLGVGGAWLIIPFSGNMILEGIVAGLSAAGLYSGAKVYLPNKK